MLLELVLIYSIKILNKFIIASPIYFFIASFIVIVFLNEGIKKIERSRESGRLYCELERRDDLKVLLSCIDSYDGKISDLKIEYPGGVDGHVAVSLLVREADGADLNEILSAVRNLENVIFALFM